MNNAPLPTNENNLFIDAFLHISGPPGSTSYELADGSWLIAHGHFLMICLNHATANPTRDTGDNATPLWLMAFLRICLNHATTNPTRDTGDYATSL